MSTNFASLAAGLTTSRRELYDAFEPISCFPKPVPFTRFHMFGEFFRTLLFNHNVFADGVHGTFDDLLAAKLLPAYSPTGSHYTREYSAVL